MIKQLIASCNYAWTFGGFPVAEAPTIWSVLSWSPTLRQPPRVKIDRNPLDLTRTHNTIFNFNSKSSLIQDLQHKSSLMQDLMKRAKDIFKRLRSIRISNTVCSTAFLRPLIELPEVGPIWICRINLICCIRRISAGEQPFNSLSVDIVSNSESLSEESRTLWSVNTSASLRSLATI